MKIDKGYSIPIAITAIIIGFFFGITYLKDNIWTGIYYPDIENMDDSKKWVLSPPLYSLDECRRWVDVIHESTDNSDYSCGRGCRFTTKYGDTMICKEDSQ
jgi:hypothetical protein